MALNIGDALADGSIIVQDKDRLCYQVLSTSKGASGVRTISKALLDEWIAAVNANPQKTSQEIRTDLCGKSSTDKFEYGYNATLQKLAEMSLGRVPVTHQQTAGKYILAAKAATDSKVFQRITYGAPGTGKSWGIEKLVKQYPDNVVRTTFHPDSDYSTFVGAYKPTMADVDWCYIDKGRKAYVLDENGQPAKECKIVYKFVAQAFTEAYVKAWQLISEMGPDALEKPEGRAYLVIEEINRGNCAQVFGDIFQLLDRKNGISSYPVRPDKDLQTHLAAELKNCSAANAGMCGVDLELAKKVFEGEQLVLPPNLCIWATMNTSDQSLFPMDSAFKRRWDWEYAPIKDEGKGWYVKVGADKYKWWSFLEKINEIVYGETESADKKMGYFFVKLPEGQKEISVETFVNKVAFYLWNDVFKDCEIREDALKLLDSNGKPGEPIKFIDFFKPHSSSVEEKIVKDLMDALNVEKESSGSDGQAAD